MHLSGYILTVLRSIGYLTLEVSSARILFYFYFNDDKEDCYLAKVKQVPCFVCTDNDDGDCLFNTVLITAAEHHAMDKLMRLDGASVASINALWFSPRALTVPSKSRHSTFGSILLTW